MTTAEITTQIEPDEVVETVDCSYCDTPIAPEVEDFNTALKCSCGDWHHYDCGTNCVEYIDNLKEAAYESQHADDRGGRW